MGNHHISNSILQIICVLLTWVILLGFNSHPSLSQEIDEQETYDLILEVKRDRQVLSQALLGLERNKKYYIPAQALAQLVQFNSQVDLESGIISGFFITEENTYSIDAENKIYTLRGKRFSFAQDEAFVSRQQFGIGDIYITTELLNKIWPLDASLETLLQTLEINTNKKLPYELSLDRERKRNRLTNKEDKSDSLDISGLKRIDNSYKFFSLPALDFSSTTSFGGAESGVNQSLNITGRNDLLKAQANYNFNFSNEGDDNFDLDSARFLLERKSYEEGDLPLGLQLAQLGDVRPKPSRLIDGSLRGRGALISTESQKQVIDFDQITVEGFAEPGWEVELYRNNELLDFQIVDGQGEYRFENVSLNYNNTIIKTIFYGPEGQIREEEKNYKLKQGISSWLSGFTTFTSTPTRDGEDRNYATLGVNLSFLGISGLAEAYKDLSGGEAYDVRLAGNVGGVSANLRNSFFSDFESEEANFDGAARKSRTQLLLSKPIKFLTGSLGLRFRADLFPKFWTEWFSYYTC